MNNIYILLLVVSSCLYSQNRAVTFNGINQFIHTSSQQSEINFTTGNFSIEAWVKPAAFTSGTNTFEHTILGNDSWASGNSGYVLRTGGSRKLDFTFGNGANWYSVTSTNTVFTEDVWTHIAVVRSGTTFTLYVNGVQVAQQTFTQNIASAVANLRIGENGNSSGRFFNGAIDEVKFWNIARTDNEVREDLNENTSLSDALRVYYKMDNTTGNLVNSQTTNTLNATYTPSTIINTTEGYFRTYNFIVNDGFYEIDSNWKDNLKPIENELKNGDKIFINNVCRLGATLTLNIPVNVQLQINPNATLNFNFSGEARTLNNWGKIENYGLLTINQTTDRGRGTINNYNLITNFIDGSINFLIFNLKNVAIVQNSGIIKFGSSQNTSSGFQTINIDTNCSLLNLSNGQIFSNSINNNGGYLKNQNTIYCDNSLINQSLLDNLGSITCDFSFSNNGTTNNDSTLILKGIANNSGTIQNSKLITFESNNTNRFFNNSGTINILGSLSEFKTINITSKFVNKGIFKYENLVTNNGVFQNDVSGTIDATTGSFRQFDNYGIYNNAGTYISGNDFYNYAGSSNTQSGTHQGDGFFSSVVFTNTSAGNISPGNPIGQINFSAGLINNGSVNIEIAGTESNQMDRISSALGTISLNGTLNLSLFNGFYPPIGITDFIIVSANNITGTFSNVNLPTLSGTTFSILYTATSVIIRANTTTLATESFELTDPKLYPNPTSSVFTIQSENPIDNVFITNTLGQVVFQQKAFSKKLLIDISAIERGVYFVNIFANNNKKTVKIFKN